MSGNSTAVNSKIKSAETESSETKSPESEGSQATPFSRNPHIDAIRGLAVLGIFLMNILYMGNTLDGYSPTQPAALSDPLLALLTRVLFEGRFIGLFTLLFGVGLAVQFARLTAAGEPTLQPMTRRLKVLMLIGLIHGLFIWPGDVLLSYGISAMLAIHYLGAELHHLKRRALQFIALSFVMLTLFAIMIAIDDPAPRGSEQQLAALAPWIGSYGGQLLQHLTIMSANLLTLPFAMLWYTAGMMLLGMWLYRCQFFTDGLAGTDTAKLWLLALALISLDLCCYQSANPYLKAMSQVTAIFAAIPVSLLYALGIMWLQRHNPLRLVALQRVGKLALSFYVLQSIVGVLCFRYLFPEWLIEFDRSDYLLVALGFGLCQLFLATLYFKLASQGPLEWLWRRLAAVRPRY